MKRILDEKESIIPKKYLEKCKKNGIVEIVKYHSYDYIKKNMIIKDAVVYLPYGYNRNKKYDIIYFLHGFEGNQYFIFDIYNIQNIFDNLIEKKETKKFIFVSLSYLPENSKYTWEENVAYANTFHLEFKKVVLPFFEKNYSTFSEDISENGFNNSRMHRFFSGFSLGAITTWWMLKEGIKYINYFIPISGCACYLKSYDNDNFPIETADLLEEYVKDSNYNIFQFVGAKDEIMYNGVNKILDEILTREKFRSNVFYFKLEHCTHDFIITNYALYYFLKNYLN